MSVKSDAAIAGGAVIAVALLVYLYRVELGNAAYSISPLNKQNIIAAGANDILSEVTGEKTTIGEWTYDLGGESGNRNLFGQFTDWFLL